MAYPGTTDWPTSLDAPVSRVDNVDTVYDEDFNYPDSQIRAIQAFLGTTGDLIGAGVAGQGAGGMISPIADGASAIAFQLIARDDFATVGGKLLSLGDDYDAAPPAYNEKFAVGNQGELHLNAVDPLPAAGVQGRVAYKKGTGEGLYTDDGIAWNAAGGGGGGGAAPKIVVGCSAAPYNDTAADCDYLDTGDGAQLAAAIAAAGAIGWGVDVWIRPGEYDLGAGGTPTERIDIPAGVTVRGAGRWEVYVYTATGTGQDNHAFSLNEMSALMDVSIWCPEPTGYTLPSTSYVVSCLDGGAIVERVRIEFDGYWGGMLDPYYAEYTQGAFGTEGFSTYDEKISFVDCEVWRAPYSTVNQLVHLYHDISGAHCMVERLYGQGGTAGIYLRGPAAVMNCYLDNTVYNFFDGIEANFPGGAVRIIGNHVYARMAGGNGSKAYRLLAADHCVVSGNTAQATLPSAGAEFLDISQSDNCSIVGNACENFTDGLELNSFADDNIVMANNMAGASITDSGSGNDVAHNL